jgi:hypothetical protein
LAVTVNATGQASSGTGASTLTLASFSAAAGSNRFLEVWVGAASGSVAAPTGVTWGGNALTQRGTALTGASFANISKWFIKEASFPGGATGDIVATWAASQDERGLSALVTQNVDQTNPYRNASQVSEDDGASTTPSVTVTSNAADLVTCGIWVFDLGGAIVSLSATAGTEEAGCDTGPIAGGFDNLTVATVGGGSPTITFSMNIGGGSPDATLMQADSLQEASGGGAAPTPTLMMLGVGT